MSPSESATESTVLFVTATPDRRASTWSLDDLEAELRSRPDIEVQRWVLRPTADGSASVPDGSVPDRVVDDLRTWPLAVAAGRIAPILGARLRGIRLRRWLRSLAPDIVLLDDGLGDRILGTLPSVATRVSRLNPIPSTAVSVEGSPTDRADLWITPDGELPDGAGGNRVIADRPARAIPAIDEETETRRRRALRDELGVPPDRLLIAGWGESRLDGIDLFPRLLWALSDRHGIDAHGIWVARSIRDDERLRLTAEAERCGVADRYYLLDRDPYDVALADALTIPHRTRAEEQVDVGPDVPITTVALARGLRVVAFAAAQTREDPAVDVVADLDLDAMAAALARVDPGLRSDRVRRARSRLDVRIWADDLLAAAHAAGGR